MAIQVSGKLYIKLLVFPLPPEKQQHPDSADTQHRNADDEPAVLEDTLPFRRRGLKIGGDFTRCRLGRSFIQWGGGYPGLEVVTETAVAGLAATVDAVLGKGCTEILMVFSLFDSSLSAMASLPSAINRMTCPPDMNAVSEGDGCCPAGADFPGFQT